MNIIEKLLHENAVIVDVRSPSEFMGGHVAGSLNIPLLELEKRMEEIKELPTPFIVCCASGNRSGQAERFLNSKGIECFNGGSWLGLNLAISKL